MCNNRARSPCSDHCEAGFFCQFWGAVKVEVQRAHRTKRKKETVPTYSSLSTPKTLGEVQKRVHRNSPGPCPSLPGQEGPVRGGNIAADARVCRELLGEPASKEGWWLPFAQEYTCYFHFIVLKGSICHWKRVYFSRGFKQIGRWWTNCGKIGRQNELMIKVDYLGILYFRLKPWSARG